MHAPRIAERLRMKAVGGPKEQEMPITNQNYGLSAGLHVFDTVLDFVTPEKRSQKSGLPIGG